MDLSADKEFPKEEIKPFLLLGIDVRLGSPACSLVTVSNELSPSCLSYEITEAEFALYLNPYPTAFPYGNGMVLHFYQQQESSTTKTVHKVINKGLETYV